MMLADPDALLLLFGAFERNLPSRVWKGKTLQHIMLVNECCCRLITSSAG